MMIWRLLSLAGCVALLLGGPAHAWHRMPEAYVVLETTTIEGGSLTAVTIKIDAEDAHRMVTTALGQGADLDSPEARLLLAERATAALSPAGLKPLSTVFEGETAYIFLVGPEGFVLEKAQFLSSIYAEWTNYVDDQRGAPVPTRMFTQRGRPHRH